ncbi:MAG: LytTR family transcriptional regulator DNA-binding domain-containing protein [Bacteroidales bacterium]
MSCISVSTTGELTYKTGCKIIFISIPLIIYVDYQDDHCKLILSNGEKHLLCCQLKDLLDYLPSYFHTCSRNIVINLKQIKSIHNSHVVLKTDTSVALSVRKHRLLLKKLFPSKKTNKTQVINMNDYPLKVTTYPS